jgi:hypothetical protein
LIGALMIFSPGTDHPVSAIAYRDMALVFPLRST